MRALESEGIFPVKSLWRGDIPLVYSFWGYATVGSIVIYLPSLFLPKLFGIILNYSFLPSILLSLLLCVYASFSLAYYVLVMVAVWRSATKYTGLFLWELGAKITVLYNAGSGLFLIGKDIGTALFK